MTEHYSDVTLHMTTQHYSDVTLHMTKHQYSDWETKNCQEIILHPLDSHLYQMLTNLKRGIYGLKTFLRYENCVMIGIQRENMYEADVEAKSEDRDGTSF